MISCKDSAKYLALFFFVPIFALAGEWNIHSSNLRSQADNIVKLESEMEHLISEKKESHDEASKEKKMEEIIAKHKELKKLYVDFEKERNHVRYEHPEQGDKMEREYKALRLRSITEMESETGIEGRLSRAKKTLHSTYGVVPPTKKTVTTMSSTTTTLLVSPKVEEENKKRIKLSF